MIKGNKSILILSKQFVFAVQRNHNNVRDPRRADVQPPAQQLADVQPPAQQLADVQPPAQQLADTQPPAQQLAVRPPQGQSQQSPHYGRGASH